MKHNTGFRDLAISVCLFGALFLSANLQSHAQFLSQTWVGLGMTTAWINGSNSATEQLLRGEGAGFDGQQLGFAFRTRFNIDPKGRFRVPLGLDYIFYRGGQRITYPSATFTRDHRLDMPTVLLGFEVALIKLNALSQLYAGLEGRLAFVQTGTLDQRFVRFDGTELPPTISIETKDAATRFGTALRLGVQGIVTNDIHIDFSAAYGVINLSSREDDRGELLDWADPSLYDDVPFKESLLGNFLFTFMVMYKL